MNNTTLNIQNLTKLWKLAGKAFDGYCSEDDICYSQIENDEWPNRVWIKNSIRVSNIQKVKSIMEKDEKLTFSYFNTGDTTLREDIGFRLIWLQYGMSLVLANRYEVEKNMEFIRVTDTEKAALWSQSFYKAFNYSISSKTIFNTKDKVQYFLVYHNKELLGTIVLFVNHNVAGIHSLGIIPSKRKQGYAFEVMRHMLNRIIDQNLSLVTLQASEMAKEMYLKLNFKTDFVMENYKLNDEEYK